MNVLLINSGSTGDDGTGNSLRSGSAIINFDMILLDTSASRVAVTASLVSSTASFASELFRKYNKGWAWDDFESYPMGTITSLNGGFGWTSVGVCSTGSSIITRSFDRGQNIGKCLALSNGAQFGRRLPFGDAWNRLIIGVMMRVNNTASQMTVDGKIGICSGTTNMVASATCDNFFGWQWGDNGASPNTATWSSGSFASGSATNPSGSGNYNINPAPRFCTKRGTTVTDRGSGAGTAGNKLAASTLVGNQGLGFYSLLMIEMARVLYVNDSASVNYNQSFRMSDTGSVEYSMAKSQILDAVGDNPTGATLGGFSVGIINPSGAGGVTQMTQFAFEQSNGKLDTFNFSWQHSSSLELAAFAVRKIY